MRMYVWSPQNIAHPAAEYNYNLKNFISKQYRDRLCIETWESLACWVNLENVGFLNKTPYAVDVVFPPSQENCQCTVGLLVVLY